MPKSVWAVQKESWFSYITLRFYGQFYYHEVVFICETPVYPSSSIYTSKKITWHLRFAHITWIQSYAAFFSGNFSLRLFAWPRANSQNAGSFRKLILKQTIPSTKLFACTMAACCYLRVSLFLYSWVKLLKLSFVVWLFCFLKASVDKHPPRSAEFFISYERQIQ